MAFCIKAGILKIKGYDSCLVHVGLYDSITTGIIT